MGDPSSTWLSTAVEAVNASTAILRADNDSADHRYDYVACPLCGEHMQLIDFGSAAHALRCVAPSLGYLGARNRAMADAADAEKRDFWLGRNEFDQDGFGRPLKPGT